ncbi:MAG: bifunctional glutamate N-acetyltransferase/amino-acid acetyltransferase ArgJ [Vicinamibacteria bacterium]|nr:bifunctional glutamate N-acetyltransferase/amino-acid acetyltransferase ArgJ [Vicinamibacteria bacterium]
MTSGVTAARGFRAAAVEAGIKPGRTDLALLVSDWPCVASGVFTTNLAKASCVLVSAEHLRDGTARAVIVNAGCANAATGRQGMSDTRETAALTAEALGCAARDVLVSSTGVIGVNLPMDKIRAAIPRAVAGLSIEGGAAAAQAIMTTDTKPKEASRRFEINGITMTVGGMAKGAGMIAPALAPLHATMLAYFTTDAAIERPLLDAALLEAVGSTFNRITIDSDTSTNDTAVVLANGASGASVISSRGAAYDAFLGAFRAVSRDLALMMIRDGEGVRRVAEIVVKGARTTEDALRIGRTIADSPLVKTALHGGDPNWGRILAAAGRAGVYFDINTTDVHIGEVFVCENGAARVYDEALAHQAMLADPGRLTVDLHAGEVSESMWMCDLTKEYVDINAHYRT